LRDFTPVVETNEHSGYPLVFLLLENGAASVNNHTFEHEAFVGRLEKKNGFSKEACRGYFDVKIIGPSDELVRSSVECKTLKKLQGNRWRPQVVSQLWSCCVRRNEDEDGNVTFEPIPGMVARSWVTNGVHLRLAEGRYGPKPGTFLYTLSPILDLSTNFEKYFPTIMEHLFPGIHEAIEKHCEKDPYWIPLDFAGLSEALHKIESLQKENASLKKELDAVTKELDAVTKELDAVKKENREQKKELDAVTKELDAVKKENREQQKEISELKKKVKETEAKLEKVEAEFRSQLKELTSQLAQLKYGSPRPSGDDLAK
jgi:hypothetical protein